MPLRRPLLHTASLLPHIAHPARPIHTRTALFHTTGIWRSEAPNFYETLDLDPSASAGAIKKQFYSLSKNHHPDHNPNDPQASERFVKISEAYAVLGSPQKRERYDRDTQRSQANAPPPHTRRGSHSSASTPFGSRPGSGLSKRRTQFKGPPPSFYRSGGWGTQSSKRQSQADASGPASTEAPRGGGFGPGQGQAGFDHIPHFDHEGHHRMQEQQDQRRRRRIEEESVAYTEGGSTVIRFFVITAVVTFAFSIPTMFDSRVERRRKKDDRL